VHIDTERLYLRPMAMRDVDDLVALHADPEVSRYMRPLAREEVVERPWRDENAGSIRVVERLGMTPLRDDSLFDVPVVVHFVERGAF
jgi:RimJ/RimL family protein N-acetyltransferase